MERGNNNKNIEFRLSSLLSLFKLNWLTSLAGMVIFFLIGNLIISVLPAKYQTQGLIQVTLNDSKDKVDVVNDLQVHNSGNAILGYIALLKSSYILEPIVKQLGLDIRVHANYFPIIGYLLVNNLEPDSVLIATLADYFPKYCWSDKCSITVSNFTVPDYFLRKEFTIQIIDNQTYRLIYDGKILSNYAKIGKPLIIAPLSLAIEINSINAPANTEFILKKQSSDDSVIWLQNNLIINSGDEKGNSLLANYNSGLINIELPLNDSIKAANIINLMIKGLIQSVQTNNLRRNNRIYDFVTLNLPKLKQQLDNAESALANYKKKSGVVIADSQADQLIIQIGQLDDKMIENQTIVQQYQGIYTKDHPFMQSLNKQYQSMTHEKQLLQHKLDTLPGKELTLATLQRKVDLALSLYQSLLDRKQELQMAISATDSPIQILTAAKPTLSKFRDRHKVILLVVTSLGFLSPLWLFLFIRIFIIKCSLDDLYVQLNLRPDLIISYKHKNKIILKAKINNFFKFNSRQFEPLVDKLINIKSGNNVINFISLLSNSGTHYIALGLAHNLANEGRNVLLLDLSQNKDLPPWIIPRENTDLQFSQNFEAYEVNQQIGLVSFKDKMTLTQRELLFKEIDELKFIYDFIFIISAPINNNVTTLPLNNDMVQNIIVINPQLKLSILEDCLPTKSRKTEFSHSSTYLIYNDNRRSCFKGMNERFFS